MRLTIRTSGIHGLLKSLGAVMALAALAACSSPNAPKPAELGANTALLGVRLAWSTKIPEVAFPLQVGTRGDSLAVAGSDGTVLMLQSRDGREQWRAQVGSPLAAGVGTDGKQAAVVTTGNELVVLEAGKEIWRQKLSAQSFTAPLVAGGRVFLLTADRTVLAYDGASGRRLWQFQRPGEPLVLRKAGVLLAVGDTLVAGLSGRLTGINPNTGTVRWEAPIATPRGTNDVERLVDLVGRVNRNGDVVCARAFQSAVGCVSTSRGIVMWSKPANGAEGVHGDDRLVIGTEADGKVVAWRRADGERAWTSDRLAYRGLTAPLLAGRSVVIGDSTGLVHFLSREDGSPLNRLSTDGSAVVGEPLLAGDTLVVVTRNGGVFGFLPD